MKGKFDQLKGKIKEAWGNLNISDDDIALYNEGKQDQFYGKLEEKYGLMKEEAQSRMREIERSIRDRGDRAA